MIFSIGCAPIFSDIQSPKLVGKGDVEIAPHVTMNKSQISYGMQIAYGLGKKVDIPGENLTGEIESFKNEQYTVIIDNSLNKRIFTIDEIQINKNEYAHVFNYLTNSVQPCLF